MRRYADPVIRAPKPDATMSVTRTEAYTDGVFAIAATLLVLDLSAASIGHISSDADMWAALGGMWDNILAFLVSFILLSGLWAIHLRQFRDIVRVDAVLLWLNNTRLLFIVLMPFTTMLTAEYADFYAGRTLMPVNFFLAALAGHLSWRWAAARGGHLMRDGDPAEHAVEAMDGLSAVVCAGVAMLLSPFIGSWGFLVFAVNGVLTDGLRRLARRRAASAPQQTSP